nr:hypothetical protein Iba_scaffold36614CG0010 [Ipomoea batatas]GMD25294.1 hypothetical protein Iba_scaffold42657CG0010 [Ipomoea batatas]
MVSLSSGNFLLRPIASIINLDNSQALINLRLLRHCFFPHHNFFQRRRELRRNRSRDLHRRSPVVQTVVLRPLLGRLVMWEIECSVFGGSLERIWWWSSGARRRRLET